MTAPAILLANDKENDVFALTHALGRLKLVNPVQVVGDGLELLVHLVGVGSTGDRFVYPQPEVLFLDLNLRGRTALEVLEWFKEHPEAKPQRVYAWGEDLVAGQLQRALALGADGFLPRSASPDEYLALLRALPGIRLEQQAESRVLAPC